MTIEAPFPELDELMLLVGEAGQRISDMPAKAPREISLSLWVGRWTRAGVSR